MNNIRIVLGYKALQMEIQLQSLLWFQEIKKLNYKNYA